MDSYCIILVDDNKTIHETFNHTFEDLEINLEIIHCYSITKYISVYEESLQKGNLKAIIFDLANNRDEESSNDFSILEFIQKDFETNRIPIFIHSAFLKDFNLYENNGTIFKVLKSKNSIVEISEKIKLFMNSGFLDIFSFNGSLESKIMKELHSSFVSQYKHNEIEEIIKSINNEGEINLERTMEVFERMAIKSLFQNIVNPKEIEGNITEVKVNPAEHYYRRIDGYKLWTGDIFKNIDNDEYIIILTPRCNIGHQNYDELLICKIIQLNEGEISNILNQKIDDKKTGETKGIKKLRLSITDGDIIGERLRYLPKTPQFCGGNVDFITATTIKKEVLEENYSYTISLVDDLTNDIVRKYANYMLRGGISETDYIEASYYFNEDN